MKLRQRVLVYMALAAVASCALTVLVGVVLVKHQVSAQRLATLENQAKALAQLAPPGEHVYIGLSGVRPLGPAATAVVLAAIPAGDGEGTAALPNRTILYAARSDGAGRVVVVGPAALAFAAWRPFLWALVLAGLGGVLLAALLSLLLTRRLTRPLAKLADATRRVAAGEAGVTVPASGSDELADLGRGFNQMSTELAHAREADRSFLESVSHELRTPLTSIRGYAEALEEGAVAPATGARVIAAESRRVSRLVTDLLELARFGRAGFAVAREPVNLRAVAEQVVERHVPQAHELRVKLSADSSAGPSPGRSSPDDHGVWVLGDADRLLQATSNLVENALRLTPAGGSVSVEVEPGAISVRDTGPGLDSGDIEHAFERFYLHDRYRSQRPVGSGLGLAIVRELAVAMGGSVSAASAPGGGARFTITLPAGPSAGDRDLGAGHPAAARADSYT